MAEADRGNGGGTADRGPVWEGGLMAEAGPRGAAEAPQTGVPCGREG
jgi:hypothetical protein